MARICCVTQSATYQGSLDLQSTSGQQMRLLDALNTPQRLQKPATLGETSLFLEGGVRKDHRSGRVETFDEVAIRLPLVLAAYELALDAQSEDQRVAAMKDITRYEQQRSAQAQREEVTAYLPNGWRVQGHVTPSRQVLHESRTSRPFVPILDVTIHDPVVDGNPKSFPFLAVNIRRIEALGS